MNKHYSVTERANVQILSITSLSDEWENRQLLNELQERIDTGAYQFVVDLVDLKLISSVGVNFLLTFLRRVQNVEGQLLLANVCDFVTRLLEVTRLTSVFELTSSLEAAIEQLEEEKVLV